MHMLYARISNLKLDENHTLNVHHATHLQLRMKMLREHLQRMHQPTRQLRLQHQSNQLRMQMRQQQHLQRVVKLAMQQQHQLRKESRQERVVRVLKGKRVPHHHHRNPRHHSSSQCWCQRPLLGFMWSLVSCQRSCRTAGEEGCLLGCKTASCSSIIWLVSMPCLSWNLICRRPCI